MNNEKWNEICFLLHGNLKPTISESDFEQKVTQALSILDWKEYTGDVKIRQSISIGSARQTLKPDFIISSEGINRFVIEIKQPNISLTSEFQQQLFSYMRQLKLEYGILIGQEIQVFYDGNLKKQENPILLETIKFTKDNEKGLQFIKLFAKDAFNEESLQVFASDILKKIDRKEESKKLTDTCLSVKFEEKIIELIKENLLNEYDSELIEEVWNKLKIEIKEKELYQKPSINSTIPHKSVQNNDNNLNKDQQKNKIQTNNSSKYIINEMKIGNFVQDSFRNAYQQGLISQSEITLLLDEDYSRKTFSVNFAILIKESAGLYDHLGYHRYYIKEKFCGNYYLTNHWVIKRQDKFISWLDKIGYEYSTINELEVTANMIEKENRHPKRTINGMKIGEFVQDSFRNAYQQGLISQSEITNLLDKGYSKKTFPVRSAILRKESAGRYDRLGYKRYYTEKFCDNYYLYSEWGERHFDSFLPWLDKIGYEYPKDES